MKRRIRIAASLSSYSAPNDAIANHDIRLWRGGEVAFDLGFFLPGRPGEDTFAGEEEIAALESVSLTLKPMTGNNTPGAEVEPVVAATIDTFRPDATWSDWASFGPAHATIDLSTAQMALAAGAYWLTIWALTVGGEKLVAVAGKITVLEASVSEPGEPPEVGAQWITISEADVRYFRASEDGTLAPDQLPDVIPARIVVLGGTAVELDAMTPVPAQREIRIEEDATGKPIGFRVGAADGRPGGYRIGAEGGESGSGGIDIHVPGSITLVCGQNNGTVSLMPISRDGGQVSVLWWDSTIASDDPYPIGATLDMAVTSPSAAWTNAPKLIRVFPADITDALKSLQFASAATHAPNLVAVDWRGTPLEAISLAFSPQLTNIPPIPATMRELTIQETGLTSLDLSGMAADDPSVDDIMLTIFDNANLSSIRFPGLTNKPVSGSGEWRIENNNLSAAALDTFFADLPARTGEGDGLIIYIAGNPGTATCDISIATDKGYGVETLPYGT